MFIHYFYVYQVMRKSETSGIFVCIYIHEHSRHNERNGRSPSEGLLIIHNDSGNDVKTGT